MDLGKDQSHPKLQQTSDPHPKKASAPGNERDEIIGSWSLRNREQLRKRKAEAQEKQTSQWIFREEKKRKWQRTGKGNQRGRKKKQNAEPMVKPPSQTAKGVMEKELAPTGKEMEPPRSVTEAHSSIAFPQHSSEIHQESISHQENSSEYQEIVVQSHYSETCQHLAEPEDLSPKICLEVAEHQDDPSEMCQDMAQPEALLPDMCQEASEAQDHSSNVCQDMAQSEVLSPKTSQEMAVVQYHPLKMYQDMVEPEVSSTKVCQEVAVPKALPFTSEDVAGPTGCSPEASPKLEEPKGYADDTTQRTAGPEELIFEPDQGTIETKEVTVPKNHSIKTYQEIVKPEYFSHEAYEETPEPEDYSPEIYQGPEDLSTKAYKNRDVPKECLPEPYQEESGSQGQNPKAQEEDAKKVYTFPPEVNEKAKAEEPEISAIPHSPQEIRQENDVYSYVLF
ncbi:hemogen isoform X1 [Perognathus longimembris pacificus]|uniref:hemogen isoform X1 n=1 Tax=Perognathus longimembris pacificus TaxID=214514 RepID=UPI0020184DAE|nr:hemogen isoform X1 [Perognathus longimembris pacificus]XP_048193760.1 hemogen isoform X1 [Perognathus longimembris pacificus]